MAEKKIIFDLDLKTQQANQNVDGILKQLNEVGAVDLSKPFKTFKQELREAQTLVKAVGDTYGETSKEFSLAASNLAKLKDEQQELNQKVQSFNPDNKFQSLVSLSRGAVGAVQGVASAFTLMGVEAEQANEIVARLNALAGLSDFANSLDDIKNSYSNFTNIISQSGLVQQANNQINKAATGILSALGLATETTSTAFKGLRGALIATGIGAIIVGVGLLIANFDKLKEALGFTSKAQEAVNETLKDYQQGATKAIENVNKVKTAFELAKSGVISKQEALQTYNDTLGDSLGKTNDLATAEKLLADKADAYIKMTALKAQANALFAKSAEATAKALTAGSEDQTGFFGKAKAFIQGSLGNYGAAVNTLGQAQANGTKEAIDEATNSAKALEDKGVELLKQAGEISKGFDIKDDSKKESPIKKTIDKSKDDLKNLIKELNDELFNRTATELDKELKKIEDHYQERLKLAKGNSDVIKLINDARIREEADAFNKYNQPQKIDLNQVKEETKQVTQIKVDGEKLLSNGLAEARKTDVNKLKESKQDELRLFEKNRDGVLQFNSDISDSIGVLSDVVEKNSTEGKALAIADATIKTFNAANTALASAPPPFNFIQMAAVIAAGFINVKKIISTKLPKGDNVSASSPSLGNLTAPSINPTAFQANGVQNVRVINQDDRIIPAVISDRELQNQQQRKSFLNNLSSF